MEYITQDKVEEPTIDTEEEARYIAKKTGLPIETIRKVQKAQEEYWKEKGIIEER